MVQVMAGDWRTLKLEVLAETKDFVKGMGAANKKPKASRTSLQTSARKQRLP
jgi:hypothetical protein